MTLLGYERYCAEIVAQSELLRSCTDGADPAGPVPSCPGWSLGRLVRHVGALQRWAEEIVRTRATQPVPGQRIHDLSADVKEDTAILGPWLAEGAARLAETLRGAGPGAPVWTPVPGGTAMFYARRLTYEAVIHRADAALAVGADFSVAEELALDAIDEWMELGSRPGHSWPRELPGPGRTLHFHATDTAPEAAAEWVVDLTGDAITWRRAHQKAAVAVRGPLTDLLLVIYKRRPARGDRVEILGDAQLLDSWLGRVSFG